MIETKYKVKCEGNAKNYGIRNGDWVNKEVFNLVQKDIRAKCEQDIHFTDVAIFCDGVMIRRRVEKQSNIYPYHTKKVFVDVEKEHEICDIDEIAEIYGIDADVVNWAKKITARIMGDE